MNFIFDLDGTLINSKKGIFNAYKLSLKNYIEPIEEKKFESYIGPPFAKIIKKIHPNLDTYISKNIINNFRELYDNDYYKEFNIYNGIIELIQKISTFSRCFIVTNKPTQPSIEIINKLKLNNYFTEIVGVNYFSKNGLSKKENISKLIIKNNLSKKETFYIGDTRADAEAAQENNIYFIAYTEGYYTWKENELKGIFYHYKNPNNLYLKVFNLKNF